MERQLRTDAATRRALIVTRLAVGVRPIDVARELQVSPRTVRRATAAAREELTTLFGETLAALARRALEGGSGALAVLEAVSESRGSSPSARVAAARARLDIMLRLAEAVELEERMRAIEGSLGIRTAR
jgi:hypothetical protein